MDKNLHQIAKAPMIALIEKKNIMENKMKRAFVLLLLLGLMMPLAMQAQDVGNPSRALNECLKPTQLTVSQITTNSAQLSWTENGDADTWIVAYRTDDDDDFNEVITAENPYNLTGLTPETYYIVKVSPYCENEKWSNEIAFITLEACPAPTGLQVDNMTATTATLSWTGFSESYIVRYRTSMVRGERGATASEWQTYYTSEPTLTLTGLVPETDYEAQVQGDCGNDGYSEWSEIITFTTESDWFAGSGTEDDPYLIATTDDMDALAALVNGGNNCSGTYFLMTDDLDYSGKDYSPIGNTYNPFSGFFDGNGHTISNVTLSGEDSDRGVFARVIGGGIVENLTLDQSSIGYRGYSLGGIAGDVVDATIRNCINKASITANDFQYDGNDIGGIVGYAGNSNIIDCQNYGDVDGCYRVGGIVGSTGGNTLVSGCQNHGDVNYSGGYLSEYIGGIVGDAENSTISHCKNTGIVFGYYTGGGIVGYAAGCTVNHCLNLGNVNVAHERVGGIVGRARISSVSNCLHLGKIEGYGRIGGIVGRNEGTENTYANNYHRESLYAGIEGTNVEGQAMYGYAIEAYAPLSINLEGNIGLTYEGNVYAGNEQGVVVSYEIQNSSLTPQCYTLSAGTLEDNGDSTFTITMPAEDITISGNIVEFYGTYYEIPCNGDTTATVIYDDSYLTLEHVDIEDFECLGKQYTVTAIADGAFDGCDSIIYFDCHSNISTIGDHAMRNCTGIDYFGFYHTPTPPTLGEGVFEGLSLDTLWLMIPFCSQYDYSTHPVFGQFGEIFPDGNCEYSFINQSGDKLWSNPANWAEGEVPGETARVAIFDDCEIDTDVTVGSVTIGYYYDEYNGLYERLTVKDSATLTATNFIYTTGGPENFIIEDGAQVVHPNTGAMATMKKAITAYSTQSGVNNGWHLIALPLTGSIDVDSVGNMIGGEYDLYAYDESTAYWKNSKNTENSFTALEATKGYLYGNSAEVTLEFSGTLQNSSDTISVPLSYTEESPLSGFNLVGNPFPCEAYLDRAYYVLSANGTDINPDAIPSTVPIPPCTAVFVKALTEGDSVVFTRVAP